MQKTILSTADVARLFNVTETTVKRWADEGTLKCQKTPGGHRKFQIRQVVEFSEENNFEPAGVLSVPESDKLGNTIQMAILEKDFGAFVRAFVEKTLSPERADLFHFLSYLYQHRFQLWEIYDLVIRPGMFEIGERWARGEIGVDYEHRASYETLDALAKLQTQIMIKPPTGFSVLFACLADEMHDIGLRCAAYLFESEGWFTHYLGAGTPLEALLGSIRDLKPNAVCLSVTQHDQTADLRNQCMAIAAAIHKIQGKLIIGGAGATSLDLVPQECDGIFTSSCGLLDFIESFHTMHHHSADPNRR